MSFDHGKMIACGEGGLVLTNKKICELRKTIHRPWSRKQ